MEIALVIIFVAVCIILVIVVAICVNNSYEKTDNYIYIENIYNKSGMDIKENRMGRKKGNGFDAMPDKSETYYQQGNVLYSTSWNLTFKNIETDQVFQIRFRKAVCIGRGKGSTVDGCPKLSVSTDDTLMARINCKVIDIKNCLYIQDCGSTNHTYMDGEMIQKPVKLKNNAVLVMGNSRFRVNYSPN